MDALSQSQTHNQQELPPKSQESIPSLSQMPAEYKFHFVAAGADEKLEEKNADEKQHDFYDRFNAIMQFVKRGSLLERQVNRCLESVEDTLRSCGIDLKKEVPFAVEQVVPQIVKVLEEQGSPVHKLNKLQQIFNPKGVDKLEFRHTQTITKEGMTWSAAFKPQNPLMCFLVENNYGVDFVGEANDKRTAEKEAIAKFMQLFEKAIHEQFAEEDAESK